MAGTLKRVAAGQFKAHCLRLLDEVAESQETLIVTKRGVPVAKVVPFEPPARPSLRGSVLSEGDLLSPIDVRWDEEA